MDGTVFHCPGCGNPINIDFKTRKGVCDFCGNAVTFPRQTFNGNDKVKKELEHLVNCFMEKRYEEAKHHAESILAVAVDNAPSLFVRAYYESYIAPIKKSERMREFFDKLNDIEADIEEIEPLKKMLLAAILHLDVFEKEALMWVESVTDNDSDLCAFADSFCPIIISRRTTIDYMTIEMAATYKRIAARSSAPKTCYALLQSVLNNPDSPFKGNSFYLKTKTQRFYNDYLLPVGEIVGAIASEELKGKFCRVYNDLHDKFIKNIQN